MSTGPAPPRPGTATVPWRPCTAPHSRASTLPIAHNRHRHRPSDDTHKHWQTTPVQTRASMLQRVPGRGSTQGKYGNSPERLGPIFPGLHATAARRAHRGAPGSSAGTERLVPARADGAEDEPATVGVDHEVGKVAHGGLDDLRTTNREGQAGRPSRGRRRGHPQSVSLFT